MNEYLKQGEYKMDYTYLDNGQIIINGTALSCKLRYNRDFEDIEFIRFKVIKVDNDYINKYRLIFGREFESFKMVKDNNKLTIECASTDGLIYLDGNLTQMFSRLPIIKYIDLSHVNTYYVRIMDNMFYGCKRIEKLDLSNFDTSNVTNMRAMFDNCESLESVIMPKFNAKKLKTMERMFRNCLSLRTVDLGNTNFTEVWTTKSMFRNCKNLQRINIGNLCKCPKLVNDEDMFNGCKGVVCK